MSEQDEAVKNPCTYKGCGVHARFTCGDHRCNHKLCRAHADQGTDGQSYCPDHVGDHKAAG